MSIPNTKSIILESTGMILLLDAVANCTQARFGSTAQPK